MSWLARCPRSIWRPLTFLALVLGLLAPAMARPAAAQTALPETAAAAPETTVLFQSVNLDFEGAQWQQAEELLARLGMPDALDMWREEMLAEGAGENDFSESDLNALLGGEVAFVVTPPAIEWYVAMMQSGKGRGGDYPAMAEAATPTADLGDSATPAGGVAEPTVGFAVILRPSDPLAAWTYAERQLTTYAQERDVELEFASGPGTDLIWSELATADAIPSGSHDPMEEMFGRHSKDTFAVGHAGDFLVSGKRLGDVTAILDVIQGEAPSLADSENAQGVIAQLPAEALAFTYVNGQAIVDTLGPEVMASLQGFAGPEMPREAWGGYGGMTISAEAEGFRIDTINTLAEGVDVAALTAPNDPAVAAMAEQAPAGAFIFQAGILPPNALAGAPFALAQAVNGAMEGQDWDDQAMHLQMLPTPEEVEEQLAMATDKLGFNPASDLFDLLGDQFIAFSGFPSFGMNGIGLDAVASISTTDAPALAETAQKVAAWIDRAEQHADVSVRRDGEDTIYVVSDPGNPETPAIEFGVVDGQAVVAIGEGIAALQEEPTASLAQDEQFQTVMGMLPDDYSQVAYIDIGQAVGVIAMFTGEFGSDQQTTDADLACAAYESQELAQAALDEDPAANTDLDLDGDGTACEDAFADAGATASAGGLQNVRAFAMVSFQQDNNAGSSAVLYIAEPGA